MFKRFRASVSNTLDSLAETLAPTEPKRPAATPLQRLATHWRAVQEEHITLVQAEQRDVDDAELLRASRVRDNLNAIVTILRREDLGLDRAAGGGRRARGGAAATNRRASHPREVAQERYDAALPDAGPLKPCLEYLLEHRVLETLCTLGLADRPPGMMALVLQTLCTLLRHIRHVFGVLWIGLYMPQVCAWGGGSLH